MELKQCYLAYFEHNCDNRGSTKSQPKAFHLLGSITIYYFLIIFIGNRQIGKIFGKKLRYFLESKALESEAVLNFSILNDFFKDYLKTRAPAQILRV